MSDFGDRRKETRELVVQFTLVYEANKGKLLGYLRDLTLNGCQISGSKELESGTPVSLSIELPSNLPSVSAKELQVNAKVRRCVMVTEEPRNYAIGFEFMPLTTAQTEILEKLLKRYQFRRTWALE